MEWMDGHLKDWLQQQEHENSKCNLKGTLTVKNIPLKMNIYEHLCKIKFCIGHKSDDGILWKKILDDKSRHVFIYGDGSTSHHHGNHRKYSVNIFYLWFVVCYFRNDFHCSSFRNWLTRVQKHILQEECDVLPLSIWSTEVFNRSCVKKLAIFVDRCCFCLHTPAAIDNGIKLNWRYLKVSKFLNKLR